MDMQELPTSLQKAIEDMEVAWAKVDQGENLSSVPGSYRKRNCSLRNS